MDGDKLKELERRLLIVYTGRTRLAKNLLQEVIRSWYSRKRDVVNTISALVHNAELCAEAVKKGNLRTFAKCANTYREQKKQMAVGSEPLEVTRLLDILHQRNIIDAGWLAGAGGGGFLYLMLTEAATREMVQNVLKETPGCTAMTTHSVQIDNQPLVLSQSLP